MRDINSILNLFSLEYKMNYCQDFDILKGIFDNCNENVRKIQKIQFRGGNEAVIDDVSRRIENYFQQHGYIDPENYLPTNESRNILRKITLFLFLNSDTNFKYNLKDDPNLGHILEILPPLTKCLLINLVWNLKLDEFYFEIMENSPLWFSFQFIEPAIQSLKYIDDPYDVLEKVEKLVKAIFTNLNLTDFWQIDPVDKKIIFGKLYNYTMDLLRLFYTPDAEKFDSFRKSQKFRYSGFALKHLLDLVIFVFNMTEAKPERNIDDELEIYEIGKNLFCFVSEEKSLKKHSELVNEYQSKIAAALLNSLQYNVMLVTIEIFMHWIEIDLKDDLTLQQCVGEKAYHVLERISSNPKFAHDVDQQLKCIAIRPKTIEEILKEATIGEILTKLDDGNFGANYESKTAWFNELLSRSIAFGNDECLEVISANVKLMTRTNFYQILNYIEMELENMEMECEYSYDELNKIIIKSLNNFSIEDVIEICIFTTKKFSNNSNLFQMENLDTRSTEFFNKSCEQFDLHQFLVLSFENPALIWEKFFNESCSNESQIKNFCSSVRKSLKFSNQYFEPLFSKSFFTKMNEERLYPNLIAEIYFEIYSERKLDFFKQFINNNCLDILNENNLEKLIPILKSLILIAQRSNSNNGIAGLNFGEITPPVLLMSAQIMDKCRWDLISYTDTKDEIVRYCIEFIQNVNKKFLPVATEKDKIWINKVIKKSYKPLTQYYFQKYTLIAGVNPKKFDIFLHPEEFDSDSDVEKFLISNFVRCTSKETEWLAKSERLLPHISDVILILNGIVTEIGELSILKLYRHCIVNYIKIIKKFLMPSLKSSNSVRDLSFKILNIIDSCPPQIYEEIFMNFNTLLLEIFQTNTKTLQNNEMIDEDLVRDVETFLSSMKDCKGKEMFSQKFLALSSES